MQAYLLLTSLYIDIRTFARVSATAPLAQRSAFSPVGALALMFVQGEGPLVGILQRALVTVVAGWLILVAFRVRTLTTSGEGVNR